MVADIHPEQAPLLLEQAALLIRDGQLEDAATLLGDIVSTFPECAQAWIGLGRLALTVPDIESALDFFTQAANLLPEDIDALAWLGDVQRRSGLLAEAQATLEKSLRLAPDDLLVACKLANCYVDASELFLAKELLTSVLSKYPNVAELYLLRGLTSRQMSEDLEAESDLRLCLSLMPNTAAALATLGDISREQGRLDDAAELIEHALRLAPDDVAVLRAWGDFCLARRDWKEAVHYLDLVLLEQPDNITVLLNRAVALVEIGDALAAIDALERCLGQGASDQWVYEMLGIVFAHRGQWEASLESLEKAVEENPKNANAWNVLIIAYNKLGKMDKAERAAKKVLEIDPRHISALINLAGLYIDQGRHDEGVATFRLAIECDPANIVAYAGVMFGMLFSSQARAEDVLAMGRKFEANVCQSLRKDYSFVSRNGAPDRPLRVGWVSSDLRAHPVGAFMAPLFPCLDTGKVESYVYSNWPTDDQVTALIKPWVKVWRNVRGLGDNALAESIRSDEIDILVDLNGHTAGHRLGVFARKPAPIQVEWLGYPGTSGMASIDYVLVPNDTFLRDSAWSSETPWLLPNCYGVRGDIPNIPVRDSLPVEENGYFTFACMNRFSKVSAAALDLWGVLLARVPGSRLILIGRGGADIETVAELHRRFAEKNVESDRLIILESLPVAEYFATYNRADLGLDPFPFNGGTTGFDSIWMGVPFVTLRGDALHSRAGSNILKHVGLDALIADSEAEYVEKAVALADDLPALRVHRAKLRERMQASPLLDTNGFARGLEEAFRGMWKKWCMGGVR